jgi:hypothetical protein
VRKLRLVVLVALGVLIALGAIGLISVNLYVQSQGTQAKIQQELSQRLGTPLQIRQMSVTPWGGLELSGITIAQSPGANPTSSAFLRARTFRLRVRPLSLFSRRLVIKEVSLVDPDVVWPQDSEGKWRLPGSRGDQAHVSQSESDRPRLEPAHRGGVAPETEPVPTGLSASHRVTENKLRERPETPLEVLAPGVESVNVKGGNFTFLDHKGALLASFAGVDFRTNIRSAMALRGDAKIAKISLRDRFFLEELQSPLRYEPDVLELSKISARAGNGEIDGYFAMQPESEDSPFTTSVTFHDVLADQIVANAGGPRGIVQGKLEGRFEASGKTADPEALIGKGEIFLRDGRVRQYSLLVLLGEIFQIEELRELHLEQAEAKYHVSPALVTIDELILRSPNIRLSASGTVGFDGTLKLDSQLAINDRIRSQLFKTIRQNFQPISEPGYFGLDFKVGGSIERPSTNLMDRLVGRDLSDMINSLFGGRKTERPKKKKKRTEEVMTATPSPSAVPEETPPQPAATPVPSP